MHLYTLCKYLQYIFLVCLLEKCHIQYFNKILLNITSKTLLRNNHLKKSGSRQMAQQLTHVLLLQGTLVHFTLTSDSYPPVAPDLRLFDCSGFCEHLYSNAQSHIHTEPIWNLVANFVKLKS